MACKADTNLSLSQMQGVIMNILYVAQMHGKLAALGVMLLNI